MAAVKVKQPMEITEQCWVTSVRSSSTLNKSEKVKYHISEEKTHKSES